MLAGHDLERQDTKLALPNGWLWVRLDEVCRVASGSTPNTAIAEYWNGDIIWITPTDLGSLKGNRIVTSARQITRAGYHACGTEIIPPGSVVLSSRAPIGHLGITDIPLCTNQGCKSFVPGPDVNTVFLYYALMRAVPDLQELGSGATFAEISKSQLERFRIPLPPLPDQKRIAAILQEQMDAVERARAAAEAQLEAANALPAAYLRAVFNGPEAQRWSTAQLGTVGEIMGGIQKTPERSPVRFHKPYLTVRNVQRGYLDLSQVERFEITQDEFARYRLLPGDILIVEGNGSLDHIGRNALFLGNGEDWVHQNHLIRVRLSHDACSPEFMSHYLNSDLGKSQMVEKAMTTSGLYTLSTGKVASLEVPRPPLAEQQRIAALLSEQMGRSERLRRPLEAQLDAINKLPAALLRRAFRGELR